MKIQLSNPNLIIFAFCVVFYARIIATTIHLSLLNLLHFMVVPLVCAIALATTRTRDPQQIALCFSFLTGLIILFGVTVASALLNIEDIVKTLKLLAAFISLGAIGLWCVQNVEAFKAYTAWARPELYGADGLAWYAKFYSIRSILDYYQSPLNWLLGLGPGHTVSRLGAWFLRDFAAILGPLGSTRTPIGADAMDFVANFWLTSGSSLFSPIFGWAGIWGDLGLLGLGSYLYLGYLTWKHFGLDNSLKVTLLSIFIMGLIFTQMEEPGYMLSIAYILGLSWQEQKLSQTKIVSSKY